MNDSPKFLLTIEDAGDPGEPLPLIRLRRLLKNMLREHSFRCTAVQPLPAVGRPAESGTGTGAGTGTGRGSGVPPGQLGGES